MDKNYTERQREIIQAVENYVTGKIQESLTKNPTSWLSLSSRDEQERGVLMDLWVYLDRKEIPEKLRGFSLRELRWFWLRNSSNPGDFIAQELLDSGLL